MKTARIDVAFRVGPTTDTIKVVYPTGGALVDVTLTHGLYLTADALADEINTRLQAYNVHLFCLWDAPTRTYTIRTDLANFDLQITYPTLREFLGVPLSTKYTNVAGVDGTTPGVFLSTLPWHGDTLTLCRSRKAGSRPHNRANHVPLASWNEFGVTAVVKSSELTAFRVVMSYALKGIPFTVYYDSSVLTAWGPTNWWGRRTCVLTPEAASYVDSWLTAPHQTLAEVQLELREYTASESTAATFAGAIGHTEVGVRFYAKIGGIGDVYLDGETPVGPAGSTWSAPISKATVAWTYRPYMLDVGAGLKDLGAEISRRAGSTMPGSLTLTLADNRAAYLRGLFARDLASGHTAQLTATLPYDTAGTGNVITVDSTTGWAAAPGVAYLGKETLYYGAKAATSLTTTDASGGKRDIFSLGSDDVTYRHNPNKVIPQPRIIADYPITWHGRHVRVFAFLVDHAGRAYDSAIDSTSGYTREVYRGIVQGDPCADATWRSWTVQTKSIDVILQTEIGQEPVTGQLMQVPGDKTANNAGVAGAGGNFYIPDPVYHYYAFYLDESTRYLSIEVTDWPTAADAAADTNSTTTAYSLEVAPAGSLLTEAALEIAINEAMGNVPDVASPANTPCGDFSGLRLTFVNKVEKRHFAALETGARVARVTWNFESDGSVGRLLNLTGTLISDLVVSGEPYVQPWVGRVNTAIYIGPNDTTIPFWYTESAGVQPDQAASSGYARVGEEIIEYTGISSLDGSFVVGSTNKTFQIVTPTGGALQTITLAEATYATPTTLAAQITTQIVALGGAYAGISCTWSSVTKKFTFAIGAGSFDLQFAAGTLQEWLGVPLTTKYTAIASLACYAPGAATNIAGMYKMTGCIRGRVGTTPTEHKITLGVDYKPQSEAVKITFGVGFDGVGFLTAVLRLAISTGGAHHGTYDTLAAKVGPGLCPQHFDATAITKVEAGLDPSWRKISCFIAKPIKLAELLSQWLAPLNLYLVARTGTTGLYRVTVDEVLPPLESEAATTTLGTGQLDAHAPAAWQSGNDLIINRIKASGYVWDVLKDAPKEGADVIATDDDSEYDYGVRGSLDWTLRGHNWSPGEAAANVYAIASQVFARYGRPYDVLTLKTDRAGWTLKPGDFGSLTVPEAPDPDGTSGISARLAAVLKVSSTYWDPGGEIGAEVTVIVERAARQSTYSPSARVTAQDAGVPSVTLAANQYSDTDHADVDYFDAGDVVRFFNLGDITTIDTRTIVSKAGNVLTISAALANCTPGTTARMVAAPYATAQASQRAHAFVASNATPPALAVATTTSFKYT